MVERSKSTLTTPHGYLVASGYMGYIPSADSYKLFDTEQEYNSIFFSDIEE